MDTNQGVALSKALQVLEIFRAIDPEMQTGTAVSFLMVALGEHREGGITITDVAKDAGLPLGSTSRYIQALAKMNRHRQPGYELVSDAVDLMDRRKKVLKTTPGGKALAGKIVRAIGV